MGRAVLARARARQDDARRWQPRGERGNKQVRRGRRRPAVSDRDVAFPVIIFWRAHARTLHTHTRTHTLSHTLTRTHNDTIYIRAHERVRTREYTVDGTSSCRRRRRVVGREEENQFRARRTETLRRPLSDPRNRSRRFAAAAAVRIARVHARASERIAFREWNVTCDA